jgi:hypothetical protein
MEEATIAEWLKHVGDEVTVSYENPTIEIDVGRLITNRVLLNLVSTSPRRST